MALVHSRYYLSKANIEDEVYNVLAKYDAALLSEPQAVPIEIMAEKHWKLQIEYQTLSEEDDNILGLTSFTSGVLPVYDREAGKWKKVSIKAGTIVIDDRLLDETVVPPGRYHFTFSHEIAHWHLHRYDYLEPEGQQALFGGECDEAKMVKCFSRNIESARLSTNQPKTAEDWVEWQADYMASALLMPVKAYKTAYHRLANQYNLPPGGLIFNEENRTLRNTVEGLAKTFEVSKQAARIRLFNLGICKRPNCGQASIF